MRWRRGSPIYSGKALINSTTGEEAALERVLPLAKKYGAAVIALCNDERGPIQDPYARLEIARKIVARAADYGVPIEDLFFDPLVMTVGADSNAGAVTLATMKLLRAELGVNLTAGASNVSFGLPDRPSLNCGLHRDGDARWAQLGDHEPARARGAHRDPCRGPLPRTRRVRPQVDQGFPQAGEG